MRSRILVRLAAVMSGVVAAIVAGAGSAWAQVIGEAHPWQLGYQAAESPVMERVHEFHHLLLIIITTIVVVVLAILGYCILRFNSKRNPHPSKTAHNTLLEVVWTAVPIMILVVIAIPSLKLLYFSAKAADPEMTLKVTGHQWYWSYNYPDNGGFGFDSIPIADDEIDASKGQVRLLSVDNPVVLPVGTTIQVLVGSDDVIHDWAVPSLGLKKDATPGRVNETWVRIDREGTYYGMCSELCGVNHYFMPIEIHAVSKEDFAKWVEQAKQQFAANPPPARQLASTGGSVQ